MAEQQIGEQQVGEQLVRATQEHRVVTFMYDGLRRMVEPHMVALHGAGEAVLMGYQTAGFSRTGEVPGWRTFIVSEVQDLDVLDRTFPGPRPDFNAAHQELTEIFARA
ncbi:MAG TPA: WYL domain-containing protein [Gemmatimonadales bacterium]|nr:WYL domain-containing protein [Gemmatimonadales bacterium]